LEKSTTKCYIWPKIFLVDIRYISVRCYEFPRSRFFFGIYLFFFYQSLSSSRSLLPSIHYELICTTSRRHLIHTQPVYQTGCCHEFFAIRNKIRFYEILAVHIWKWYFGFNKEIYKSRSGLLKSVSQLAH
jgi:hypothetical protein